MINHARTLLLNRRTADMEGHPGYEYIPTTYEPIELPTAVGRVRAALFGDNPDPVYMHYRVRQCMQLLSAAGYNWRVEQLDPRIIYTTLTRLSPQYQFGLRDTALMHFIGQLGSSDATGRTRHSWSVHRVGNQLNIDRHVNPPLSASYTLIFTDGLSQLCPLPGCEASIRISSQFTDGHQELVTAYAKPLESLGARFQRVRECCGDCGDLFQISGDSTRHSHKRPAGCCWVSSTTRSHCDEHSNIPRAVACACEDRRHDIRMFRFSLDIYTKSNSHGQSYASYRDQCSYAGTITHTYGGWSAVVAEHVARGGVVIAGGGLGSGTECRVDGCWAASSIPWSYSE